jgi:menaquinone-dependent protoporphyrinogen IX oxidase
MVRGAVRPTAPAAYEVAFPGSASGVGRRPLGPSRWGHSGLVRRFGGCEARERSEEGGMVSPRVLVAFHACAEHPGEAAAELAAYLRRAGVEVVMSRASTAPDPGPYAAVVLGDGLHGGAASPEIAGYVSRHVRTLNARPCGLFVVCPAAAGGATAPLPSVPIAASGALHGPASFRPRVTAWFGTTLAPTRERWSHPPRVHGRETPWQRRRPRPEPRPDDPAAVERFAQRLLGLLIAGRAV